MEKMDLQKAKGKSLVAHFKKGAAHHTKMAAHHEAIMKAHEGMHAHHEEHMGKTEGDMKAHHKAKMAFHKTKMSAHEKIHKAHLAHADHHAAMATAHSDGDADDAKKAAFATLEIELDSTATPVVTQEPPKSGDTPVIKTTDPNTTAAAVAAPVVTPPVTAPAVVAGDPTDIQKALKDGLQAAVANGIKEIIASPEFKKTMQEQIANALLEQLGQQTAAATVKTFAVPRNGTSVLDVAKALSTGTTPQLDTTGVSAEFAHLVSLGTE